MFIIVFVAKYTFKIDMSHVNYQTTDIYNNNTLPLCMRVDTRGLIFYDCHVNRLVIWQF